MNNEIPITIEFNNAGLPEGSVRLSDKAKKVFEDMKVSGIDYMLAPGFIIKRQDEDGTIRGCEFKELSLIPAERTIKK